MAVVSGRKWGVSEGMVNMENIVKPDGIITSEGIASTDIDMAGYVTKDDLKTALSQLRDYLEEQNKETNQRLDSYEKKMETLIANAGYVRVEDMRAEIRDSLQAYPTLSETKGMLDGSRKAFEDEIRPIELQLKMISNQLGKIVALDGTVQSVVRDVNRLSTGHEEQQNNISRLTADQRVITQNLATITNTLIGVDGSGGVLSMVRSNTSTLEQLSPVPEKVTAIGSWVAEQRLVAERRVAQRAERIAFVKGLPKSRKLWGAVGTGLLAAAAEVFRQFTLF